jgi:hypothetical protein
MNRRVTQAMRAVLFGAALVIWAMAFTAVAGLLQPAEAADSEWMLIAESDNSWMYLTTRPTDTVRPGVLRDWVKYIYKPDSPDYREGVREYVAYDEVNCIAKTWRRVQGTVYYVNRTSAPLAAETERFIIPGTLAERLLELCDQRALQVQPTTPRRQM